MDGLAGKKNVRCTTVNGKQERAEDEVASRIGYTLFASRSSRIQDEVENDAVKFKAILIDRSNNPLCFHFTETALSIRSNCACFQQLADPPQALLPPLSP